MCYRVSSWFVAVLGTGTAWPAATYYLSPTGGDGAAGDAQHPWRTFAHVIPKLEAGDTLMFKDGQYTRSNSRGMRIVAGEGAHSGNSLAPITVKAEHERRAFLHSDGSYDPLVMDGCSYWTVEGIHVEKADNDSRAGRSTDSNVLVHQCNHITLRRLLVARNNRYANSHLLNLFDSHHCLVEESEFYYFHRHGLVLWHGSSRNTIRRCYFNSPEYAAIPGGYGSANHRGDNAINPYSAGAHNLAEDCITEGNSAGYGIDADWRYDNDSNVVKGLISLNDTFGLLLKSRAEGRKTHLFKERDTLVENVLVLASLEAACYCRGNENTRIKHLTSVGGTGGGLLVDVEGGYPDEPPYSVFAENSTVSGTLGTGYNMTEMTDWGLAHCNSYGNRTNWSPGATDPHITHGLSVKPNWRTSNYTWISDGASVNCPNLHGVGKNGEDIGANVFYRYRGGVLTEQPLWDPTTGEFPHGAIVAGVNDVSGASAFDVHQRLHVSLATLPPGYGVTEVKEKRR